MGKENLDILGPSLPFSALSSLRTVLAQLGMEKGDWLGCIAGVVVWKPKNPSFHKQLFFFGDGT